MLNTKTKSALLQLAQVLNQSPFTWALTASANLTLQGIDLDPQDLDLITTQEHIHDLAELLVDYQTIPFHHRQPLATKSASWKYGFEINDIEVELMADEAEYHDILNQDRLIVIRFGDELIPCCTLEAELDLYAIYGRQNKVDLIRDFLAS